MEFTKLITKLENDPHNEGLKMSISDLEKLITQAKHYYYNTDTPLLTDATYDILENILRQRAPYSEILTKVGSTIPISEEKVKLPYYMSSLDKVKPNEKSLTKWLKIHNKDIVISEKLDGLSALLMITKANTTTTTKTTTIPTKAKLSYKSFDMKLYKHGDGYYGQDISNLLVHNIAIADKNNKLNLEFIYELLDTYEHIALRGEIIIKKAIFNDKYTKMYPKARSLIAGIVNAKTPDPAIIRDMEIVFYEVINPDKVLVAQQFGILRRLGMNTARHSVHSTLTESELPEYYMQFKQESEYEIDGIVLSDGSKVFKRVVKDSPEYSVAFKMPLEEQVANTRVINVEYNVSKHGILAPRIQYEPVTIKGDIHAYTSGFNLKYIVDNSINIGTEIQIIKSGDVIPYIYKILKPSAEPLMPPKSIKWTWNETHVDAVIDNPEDNLDVQIKKLVAFFATLKIAGVGEGVVKKLFTNGFTTISDILQLTPDSIANCEGFQIKSATNIVSAIHKVIDSPLPLETVMMASGVFEIGLGERKFKMVLDAIPNFYKKFNEKRIHKSDILNISGFSDKTADILLAGMPKFVEWLNSHPMIHIEEQDVKKKDVSSDANKFNGMIVVFTGVRNPALEKIITDSNGKVSSSISSKTTVVIAKNTGESSSKLDKARDLGIQIINIDDFIKLHNIIL